MKRTISEPSCILTWNIAVINVNSLVPCLTTSKDIFMFYVARIQLKSTIQIHNMSSGRRRQNRVKLVSSISPRDAMPARYMLSAYVRLSICLSVRHKPALYRNV